MFKTHGYIPDLEIVGEEEGFLCRILPLFSLTSKDFSTHTIIDNYPDNYHNIYKVSSLLRHGVEICVEEKSLVNWQGFGDNNTKGCMSVDGHREGRYPSHRDREGGKKEVNGVDNK
jgi:hypothetical protein